MKKYISMFIVCLCMLFASMPVYAAEGKVTYQGKADQFIFEPGSEYSPTDLFPELKDVMPGDILTQKITVKNEASKKVKVKFYIRSLGAHEDSEEFLSQLGLKVKKSEENEMAYMFDAAADETAQLTDWVYLGTLYSGGTVDLDVILEVPVSLGNEHQSQIGYLDWEFMIKEYPIETTDPEPPAPQAPVVQPLIPKTGDQSNVGLWLALMAGSLIILVVLLRRRKKDEES